MSRQHHRAADNVVDLAERLTRDVSCETEHDRMRALVDAFGSPLLVLDAERLRRQYHELRAALPTVDPFFAVKALPSHDAIRILVGEGAGLDLATAGEVAMARAAGVDPLRTIHTHPIKKDSEIRAALDFGTTTFVVDNAAELEKFLPYRDRVRLLLRIRFQARAAVVDLSRKFGCEPKEALGLLRIAAGAGIAMAGVSFHVGSQCTSPDAFVEAIEIALGLIRRTHEEGFGSLDVLDIGGGFPVRYLEDVAPIEEFCAPIRSALADLPQGLRVIAEPGRFLVAPAVTALATVVGKAVRDGQPWYYLDDGVYGSFSGRLFDHASYPIEVFRRGALRDSVLAGPTCDSIDVIDECIALPDLQLGDLVVAHSMGAYTAATATDFNGLPRARLVTINDRESACAQGAVMPA